MRRLLQHAWKALVQRALRREAERFEKNAAEDFSFRQFDRVVVGGVTTGRRARGQEAWVQERVAVAVLGASRANWCQGALRQRGAASWWVERVR